MPITPSDHLQKLPRTSSVVIVLDETRAEDFEDATNMLLQKQQELLNSYPRRAAAIKAELPAASTREEIREALEELRLQDEDEMQPLRENEREASVALDEVRQKYVFRALGRKQWRELIENHPPTDEDHEEFTSEGGTGKAQYSFETFPRALVQQSSVSPKLSSEDIDEIYDGGDWNETEITMLFQAALSANTQARHDPKGKKK